MNEDFDREFAALPPEIRQQYEEDGIEAKMELKSLRRTFKDALRWALSMPAMEGNELIDGLCQQYPLTNRDAIAISMVQRAIKNGDVKAFTAIRDTVGEQAANVAPPPMQISVVTLDQTPAQQTSLPSSLPTVPTIIDVTPDEPSIGASLKDALIAPRSMPEENRDKPLPFQYNAPSPTLLSNGGAPVDAIDPKTGEVVATYRSATQAAEAAGCERHEITDVCRGLKRNFPGGYYWRFHYGQIEPTGRNQRTVCRIDPETGEVTAEYKSKVLCQNELRLNTTKLSGALNAKTPILYARSYWRYKDTMPDYPLTKENVLKHQY